MHALQHVARPKRQVGRYVLAVPRLHAASDRVGDAAGDVTTDGTMYAGSANRKPPSDDARLNAPQPPWQAAHL